MTPNMADNIERLQSLRDDTVPLRPVYEPYNAAANTLVDLVHQSLDLATDRPTSVERQKVVVCSFLATAQRAFSKEDGAVAIASKAEYWSHYPLVGVDIIKQVTKALVTGDFIKPVEDTGRRAFWTDEDGKQRSIGLMRIYTLNESLLTLDGFVDSEFIETGRPTIQVGIAETKAAKYYRKLNKRRKPKMTKDDMRKTFGKPYGVATLGVESLNTFWREHPLALPQIGNGVRGYAACATRVFHDGALDRGGRYYGAWTTLNSEYRLQSTIDGEPLAEIDLNASQPTLFSSMLGMRMYVGGMWEDLYAIVASHVDLTDIDVEDDNTTKRNKLKQVTVELIGTGNAFKRQEAEGGRFTFKDGEYARYRNALTKVVPALHQLQNTNDGGYYNGSGFISFHEAQMMMLTLQKLKDMGVVAYPVHDCLLVKDKEVDTALNVYRETIRNYIKEHGHGSVDILVPVSVERIGEAKQRVVGLYS